MQTTTRRTTGINGTHHNHNNYNFLKCDWCITAVCYSNLQNCNWTASCYQTVVIGQSHEPPVTTLITIPIETNSRDCSCKIVKV